MPAAKDDSATLPAMVEQYLTGHFAEYGDLLPPSGLYDRVISQVERPLLAITLAAARGSQIRAAQLLGSTAIPCGRKSATSGSRSFASSNRTRPNVTADRLRPKCKVLISPIALRNAPLLDVMWFLVLADFSHGSIIATSCGFATLPTAIHQHKQNGSSKGFMADTSAFGSRRLGGPSTSSALHRCLHCLRLPSAWRPSSRAPLPI